MEVKIFGQSLRIEVILVCVLLGFVLGSHLLCSCSKISFSKGLDLLKASSFKEGLAMLEGADLNYKMGGDVPNSWENQNAGKFESKDWYKSLESNTAPDPMKQTESGKMEFLAYNKFDSKCCPSPYTSDAGCACISPEQMKYLNSRGGNRTFPSDF